MKPIVREKYKETIY